MMMRNKRIKNGDLVRITRYASAFHKKLLNVDIIKKNVQSYIMQDGVGIVLDSYLVRYNGIIGANERKEFTIYMNNKIHFNVMADFFDKLN